MSHYDLKMTDVKLNDPLQRARCKTYRQPELKAAVHCKQCENPSCMAACPVGAIHKRDDKLIFIDENSCIGCRECVLACPFGAVRMAPVADGRVVATKCDLCVDTKAGTPACVKGCPKKALTLMNDETLKAWLLYKQEHSA